LLRDPLNNFDAEEDERETSSVQAASASAPLLPVITQLTVVGQKGKAEKLNVSWTVSEYVGYLRVRKSAQEHLKPRTYSGKIQIFMYGVFLPLADSKAVCRRP
jgi:hypothetical protein